MQAGLGLQRVGWVRLQVGAQRIVSRRIINADATLLGPEWESVFLPTWTHLASNGRSKIGGESMEVRDQDGTDHSVRGAALRSKASIAGDPERWLSRPGVPEVPTCQVCGRGPGRGIASSTLGAVSFSYCTECLQERAEPLFMWHSTICTCGGWEHVHEGLRINAKSWKDGRYIGPISILACYDADECERESVDYDLFYAQEEILQVAAGLEQCLTPDAHGGNPTLAGDGWQWLKQLQEVVREHRRLTERKRELDKNPTPPSWSASTKWK